jgi:hypothetical protein
METPLEWFKRKERLAKSLHLIELNSLKARLIEMQARCDHDYILVKDLFYALGETCDGSQCSKCGSTTKDIPKTKKVKKK